jgi:hypothetical protein
MSRRNRMESPGNESELARIREEIAAAAAASAVPSARLEALREVHAFVRAVVASTPAYGDDRQARTILDFINDRIRAEHQPSE